MTDLTPTPASAWLEQTVNVQLPSGKVAALRDVDPIHLIGNDGKIRQVLKDVTGRQDAPTKQSAKAKDETGLDEALEMSALADRVILASWASPAIATDLADPRIARGEAITLAHISTVDKMFVLTRAMGGKAAIDAANAFLEQEKERLGAASTGDQV